MPDNEEVNIAMGLFDEALTKQVQEYKRKQEYLLSDECQIGGVSVVPAQLAIAMYYEAKMNEITFDRLVSLLENALKFLDQIPGGPAFPKESMKSIYGSGRNVIANELYAESSQDMEKLLDEKEPGWAD